MGEYELRDLIEQVKAGRLSRRQFIDNLVTVGLGGPIAIRMLAAAGVASAQPREPNVWRHPRRKSRSGVAPARGTPQGSW
jgi:hypothetical protein